MPVTLHQPVAGLQTGESYNGPLEDWLVANGYASDGEPTDMVNLLDVTEDQNPTLAENREEPGEGTPRLFGTEHEVQDNAVERRDPVSNPPSRLVPLVGADLPEEQQALRAELDQRVAEVSEEPPALQVRSVQKAEEVAGTGDHLLTEPTDEVAPALAPGREQPEQQVEVPQAQEQEPNVEQGQPEESVVAEADEPKGRARRTKRDAE